MGYSNTWVNSIDFYCHIFLLIKILFSSIILEYEECLHAITFKNLCCDCGADLNL